MCRTSPDIYASANFSLLEIGEDMDSVFQRCRHHLVNWIDTHNCQCEQCGKYGHWFESPTLVMWHRADERGGNGAQEEQLKLCLSPTDAFTSSQIVVHQSKVG